MVLLWRVLVDIFREAVLLGEEARRKRFLGVVVLQRFLECVLGLGGEGQTGYREILRA